MCLDYRPLSWSRSKETLHLISTPDCSEAPRFSPVGRVLSCRLRSLGLLPPSSLPSTHHPPLAPSSSPHSVSSASSSNTSLCPREQCSARRHVRTRGADGRRRRRLVSEMRNLRHQRVRLLSPPPPSRPPPFLPPGPHGCG